MTTTLDRRLLAAGGHLPTELLIDLWANHRPHDLPISDTCAACGHHYSTTTPYCPTAAIIRPLLRQRCHQPDPLHLVEYRLTYLQQYDLFTRHHPSTTTTGAQPEPAGNPTPATPALF